MDKKVVIGIIVVILIFVGICLGIETSKENKKKAKYENTKTKLATSYTYDFEEERTYNSAGIEMRYVVKKVGKDIEAGTYLMKANIGANPSFIIGISDIYQYDIDLIVEDYDAIINENESYTKELKEGQYIYMIATTNSSGAMEITKIK